MYQSGMDTQGHPIVYLKPSFLDEHPEALDACSSDQLYTMVCVRACVRVCARVRVAQERLRASACVAAC